MNYKIGIYKKLFSQFLTFRKNFRFFVSVFLAIPFVFTHPGKIPWSGANIPIEQFQDKLKWS